MPRSIQSHLGPDHHLCVGRALAPLLDDGVLLLVSGDLPQNRRHFGQYYGRAGDVPADVRQFGDWMWQHIEAGKRSRCLDRLPQPLAPGAVDAHPADDHLLPLYVALGAAHAGSARPQAERFFCGTCDKLLAMDGFIRSTAAG